MLNQIIRFSLRNRIFIVVAALVVAAVGTITADSLPIDVLPDLTRPTVTILTEAHGLVPEDIEQLITYHIEQAVNGASGVERVRSASGMGLSVVYVEFGWDTDIYRNRQLVQEKLQIARTHLPPDAVPQLAPIASLMGQVQIIGFRSRSKDTDPTEIRAMVDQRVKRRLLSLKGVAQVVSTGGAPRQLQVIVNAEKLRANDVTLHEVADAIGNANLNASGGYVQAGFKGPLVNLTGLVKRSRDLEAAVVRHDHVRPIRIGDVADVSFGPAAIRVGDAGVDGNPGVVVVILKQPGMDTVELTNRVDQEIEQIKLSLPEDIEVLPGIFRQADFINRAVDNVSEAVRDGAILVLIVLFVFLLNIRTTIITLTAIPLSIAVTAIIFDLAGISINTMTLGGLAVAIGALVDDAIVDVENVFRRLRQNRLLSTPRHALTVVFRASSEVRKPILIGTVVVAAVYLPLFALSGMEGRLFTPIGITYIVSILASLLVALTVTPVLCYYLLPNSKAVERQDGWLVRHLKNGAERLIRFSLGHPVLVASTCGALVVAGMALLATRGSEFLPPFNEGSAQVNIVLPPGTSLETSDRYGKRLEQVVGTVPGVAHLGRRTGRAEGDEHAMGVEISEMIVSFDPEAGRTREQILSDIRERLKNEFPGVSTSTEQPMAHLLSHLLSGVTAQVAIKVFGDDLRELRRIGQEIEEAVKDIPGVTDLFVEPQVLVERIEVRPRRSDLARMGLDVRNLADTIELALEGEELSRLIQGNFSYPMVIRLREQDRRSIENIRNLLMRAPNGQLISVGDVADVRPGYTSNNVNRENVSRRLVVQHNVEGRPLSEVVHDVERALGPVRANTAPGYSIRISGQFEAQEEASRVITVLSIVSVLLMFLVLYSHFRSANLALQVLLNIPAAFIGAVAMIILTDQTLSVATLVGLVALAGIASRNGILLIDHYLHLMREEGRPFDYDMIVQAGRERIVPVLMTALTSGIALMPLVLSPGEPGRELLYPVASVIVGGLVSSTLLDVLLTPGVFWLFGRNVARAHAERRDPKDIEGELMALELEDIS